MANPKSNSMHKFTQIPENSGPLHKDKTNETQDEIVQSLKYLQDNLDQLELYRRYERQLNELQDKIKQIENDRTQNKAIDEQKYARLNNQWKRVASLQAALGQEKFEYNTKQLKAILTQSLQSHYPHISDAIKQQVVDGLFEKLINSKGNGDLNQAFDGLGHSALDILVQSSMESLKSRIDDSQLNESKEKLSDQAVNEVFVDGVQDINNIAAIHQSTSNQERAKFTSRLIGSASVAQENEDRMEQFDEFVESIEKGGHGAEKGLEVGHQHAIHHASHLLHNLGPIFAGVSYGLQGLTLLKKRFIDKEPLDRGDAENMTYSTVFTALTFGALLNPVGGAVTAGLAAGAIFSSVGFSLYKYYKEKWIYRREVESRWNSLTNELKSSEDNLADLNQNLQQELNQDTDTIDLSKVKKLGKEIQQKQEQFQHLSNAYNKTQAEFNEIQEERKQWYKPIRSLRQTFAYGVAAVGLILSVTPLSPIGLGMLGGGLAWAAVDNKAIGDNIAKGARAFVKNPVATTRKAVTTIGSGMKKFAQNLGSGMKKFAQNPGHYLNKAKDAVLGAAKDAVAVLVTFRPYNEEQSIDQAQQQQNQQQNEQAGAQQTYNNQAKQSPSLGAEAHHQQQQATALDNQHSQEAKSSKPSFWQKVKNSITNFFWEQPEQQTTNSQAHSSQSDRSVKLTSYGRGRQHASNKPKLNESTADLMQQLHGDQAQQADKEAKETYKQEKRLDNKLVHIIKNNDYAGVLNFVKSVNDHTPVSRSSKMSPEDQAEQIRAHFNHFNNASDAISMLYDVIEPSQREHLNMTSKELHDTIDDQTLSVIKNDETLKKAVVYTIADAKGLDVDGKRQLERQFDDFINGNTAERDEQNDKHDIKLNVSERNSPSSSELGSSNTEDTDDEDTDNEGLSPHKK